MSDLFDSYETDPGLIDNGAIFRPRGAAKDIWFRVRSSSSQHVQDVLTEQTEYLDRVRQARGEVPREINAKVDTKFAAVLITEWGPGITDPTNRKVALECNRANAEKLMATPNLDHLRTDIIRFAGNVANFLKRNLADMEGNSAAPSAGTSMSGTEQAPPSPPQRGLVAAPSPAPSPAAEPQSPA